MKTSPPLEDLRVPNIGRVPAGSYLITGLPRIRSAWLSALLTRDDLVCYHEAPTMAMSAINGQVPFGLSDPGAACLYPNTALEKFGKSKVVIVERVASQSRRALEKFAGVPATNWDALEERYHLFRRMFPNAWIIKFIHLGEYSAVDDLYRFLTGRELSHERFALFDGLRIEQDIVKRAQQEASAA